MNITIEITPEAAEKASPEAGAIEHRISLKDTGASWAAIEDSLRQLSPAPGSVLILENAEDLLEVPRQDRAKLMSTLRSAKFSCVFRTRDRAAAEALSALTAPTSPADRQDPNSERAEQLIRNARCGDTEAMNKLVSMILPELKQRAVWLMSMERAGHTFGRSGSELVQRVLEKMLGAAEGMLGAVKNEESLIDLLTWRMRNILVDYARESKAQKNPNPSHRVDFENIVPPAAPQVRIEMVLAVNEALIKLTREDPDAAKAIELRYFADLTNDEAAAAMGLSLWAFRRVLKRGIVFLKLVLGDHGPALD